MTWCNTDQYKLNKYTLVCMQIDSLFQKPVFVEWIF
jgi:hypothetical protein